MHITMLTLDSRGDVQPFIALGIGLQQAGYTKIPSENGIVKVVEIIQSITKKETGYNPSIIRGKNFSAINASRFIV